MPRRSAATAKKGRQRLRCAIYTRKSTEEGLEQDFNSLDAQREACEAFIASQKHEGWIALPTHYDDGGYSGGTLDTADPDASRNDRNSAGIREDWDPGRPSAVGATGRAFGCEGFLTTISSPPRAARRWPPSD